ncbi:MITA [Mytilus edulis]|uniref:TMEM173 n=1 Tax=Mytilus edulis TaxID=6550 RepID=A0A8S3QYR1_MYTED|nr:MITA [Mytilus edulis]
MKIPHIAVLQEAPKIYFTHNEDDWIAEAAKGIKENIFIMNVMPAGNVAHGLVWSHYSGYLQYVLPARTNNDPRKCHPGLERLITESEWYRSLPESGKKNMSFKLYEMVPSSCSCVSNLPQEDTKIKLEYTFTIYYDRAGNEREANIQIYSIKDGDQTYYCTCEYPHVLNTMKTMEQNSLASFELPILNHFNDCREKARVLLYNDGESGPEISDVLLKAIKEDLHLTDSQLPKDGCFRPKLDALESFDTHYEHQVYVAHSTKNEEDKTQAEEIISYLETRGIRKILKDDMMVGLPGKTVMGKITEAATKCRWFIFLLTKNSLDDQQLTFEMVSALGDSITDRKVRVIPVVDRREDLCIPELLQWVTYIPYNPDKSHLKSLYNIVSGQDIPLETELLLPAGYVSYGLAWGYVANYLRNVLPDVLGGINAALSKKNVSNFRCQEKLFIIIPKSCHADQTLKDKKEYPGRIQNFAKTNSVNPSGPRMYSSNIYKVLNDGTNEVDLFFVGQYAAPIACLDEMRGWNIAGVTAESMATEAKKFYEIVKDLMKQAVPDKVQFCEFVFYDDIHNSLAEIMEGKIRLAEIQNAQS